MGTHVTLYYTTNNRAEAVFSIDANIRSNIAIKDIHKLCETSMT